MKDNFKPAASEGSFESAFPPETRIGKMCTVSNLYAGQAAPADAVIWGIYRDQEAIVRAVDVLQIRGLRRQRSYPSDLNVSSAHCGLFGLNRPTVIDCGNVTTLSSKTGDHFTQGSLTERDVHDWCLPDLLCRRAYHASVANGNGWHQLVEIDPGWTREGFAIFGIEPAQNKIVKAPDAVRLGEQYPYQVTNGLPDVFSQAEIDAIAQWAMQRPPGKNRWVEPAKYPVWPGFNFTLTPSAEREQYIISNYP